ncbi:MAG: helix-turn-helix domain-containing protein [Gemmatimonadaceae bacterium]
MPERLLGDLPPTAVVAYGVRERTRELLRKSFPKRRGRLTIVRSRDGLLGALQQTMVDAVVVDLVQPSEDHWAAAALARDFPSIPFFAIAALRPADLPGIAKALTQLEFADCLSEGVDDAVLRELILPATFTARFAMALQGAERRLGLTSDVQRQAWRLVIAHGGRTVRTETIARALGLTREHLSRRFAADGAPNLKRVIDLVRLLAAAELAKNPGYDVPDIARVLGFASASHLSASCQRVIGVKSASLARLRPTDLLDRFLKQGRGRSRAS